LRDWEALRAREAAVFDEGDAFERDANAPSLSAVKGCGARLRPNLVRLLKAQKTADVAALPEAINADPVAGPAFERCVLCIAMDKEYAVAEKIGKALRPRRPSGSTASTAAASSSTSTTASPPARRRSRPPPVKS
jgi:hypothetical protein